MSPLKQNDYSLWKATRTLKQPITPAQPIRLDDGTWLRSNKEKDEMYAKYFEKVFTPNQHITNNSQALNSTETIETNNEMKIKIFSPGEIAN